MPLDGRFWKENGPATTEMNLLNYQGEIPLNITTLK